MEQRQQTGPAERPGRRWGATRRATTGWTGRPRPRRARRRTSLAVGLAFCGLGALVACDIELQAFTVNTTVDERDAAPGDGICAVAGSGLCSLRAAVDEGNALGGTATDISVPPGTYQLTRVGDDDTNDGGDLDVAADRIVRITGTGAGVVISGTGQDRVVDNRGLLEVAGVTIQDGATTADGGGMRASGVLTVLKRTTVRDNGADGRGGGVAVTAGRAIISDSTIAENRAATSGGGLYVAPAALAELSASTVADNDADPSLEVVGDGVSGAPASPPGPTGAVLAEVAGPAPSAPDTVVQPAPGPDGSVPVIIELAVPAGPAAGTGPSRAAAGAARSQVDELLARRGRGVRRTYEHVPFVAAVADPATVEALEASPAVRRVVPDSLSAPTLVESTHQVRADHPAVVPLSGSGQAVAVIDTGVDSAHVMLAGKVVAEACFAQGSTFGDAAGDCPGGVPSAAGAGSGVPCPDLGLRCWHGTHVASTASGSSVLAPLQGVAPGSDVVSVNVFSKFTGSTSCGTGVSACIRSYTSDQIAALDHVLTLATGPSAVPVAAVNMSLGGGAFSGTCNSDLRKPAIDALAAAGIPTVVASGNDGHKTQIGAPACISTAVAVGATGDVDDAVASFSNASPVVDVLAPGVSITAAYPGPYLTTAQGTSMAAPHVAGALAALRPLAPGATASELVDHLLRTGSPTTDTRAGAGNLVRPRLDLAGAVGSATATGVGGGVHNLGTLTLTSVTVTGNEALWADGLANGGAATVAASLLGQGSAGVDCALTAGSVASGGWNRAEDTTCGLTGTGDLVAANGPLGPLADNGGPTPTRLPGPGSPLVDVIPAGTAGRCDAASPPDQRGVARPVGAGCDVGAVEQ